EHDLDGAERLGPALEEAEGVDLLLHRCGGERSHEQHDGGGNDQAERIHQAHPTRGGWIGCVAATNCNMHRVRWHDASVRYGSKADLSSLCRNWVESGP